MDAFAKKFNDLVNGKTEDEGVKSALATKLSNRFSEWKRLRAPFERKWLQAIRQHKGLYDPEILEKIDDNSSKVYPKLTRAKDNMVLSRLHEMLFPDFDRNWTIEPTPVPQVDKDTANLIRRSLVKQDPETGLPVMPTREELDNAIREFVKQAGRKMQQEMDDQLLEMGYSMKVAKPTLKSSAIIGHGVVKGPLHETKLATVWEPMGDDVVAVEKKVMTPKFVNVSVWNWYPDLSVVRPEDMQGAFERHVMSKHELRQLAKMTGFKKNVIADIIKNNPDGNFTAENWEINLRNLEAGIGKNVFSSDETAAMTIVGEKKYIVYEYWGYIDITDLVESGVVLQGKELDEIEGEVYANIWQIDNQIIKAVAVTPPGGDIYKVNYWDKDDSNLFAEGLPHTMRHSQLTISAAARMLLNNAAICSGPQFEVNYELITNEDVNNIFPMKVWLREGKGIDAQYDAIRVKHVESHIDEYLKIIDTFKAFGDEETCLPTWIISQPSASETASGTSMKLGMVTMSLKDLVRNFDDFTEKIISSLYEWNMDFNEREDIKGDYKVKARGSSSLVMKEVRTQALNQFKMSLTPEDWAYIPRRQFLEELIKANDLPVEIRTEEQAAKYIEQMTDQRAKELEYKIAEAKIKKDNAMALFSLVKAKEKNKEMAEIDDQNIVNDAAEMAINTGVEKRMREGGIAGQ